MCVEPFLYEGLLDHDEPHAATRINAMAADSFVYQVT